MRIFYIDPSISGISGNMILASLIDIGGDEERFMEIVKGIADELRCNISIKKERVERRGVPALWVDVETEGECKDLIATLKRLPLTKEERGFALRVAETLLEAETKVHGSEKVRLHELGSADTLVDIAGAAALANSLGLLGEGVKVYSSKVEAGKGKVKTAHGILPVPAPATAEILRKYRIPFSLSQAGELATPTGVAILANLAESYGEPPDIVVEAVGVGAGTLDLKEPNILRIMQGVSPGKLPEEHISVLETNVDDVSGEILGYTFERLYEEGALDVQIIPTVAKKNRPGHIIQVICKEEKEGDLARVLIQETGSLGIRTSRTQKRFYLERETKSIDVQISDFRGEVRVKVAKDSEGKLVNIKPEYEDAKKVARKTGLPLRTVIKEIERQATS